MPYYLVSAGWYNQGEDWAYGAWQWCGQDLAEALARFNALQATDCYDFVRMTPVYQS